MKLLVKFIFIGISITALLSACGGSSNPGSKNVSPDNEELFLEDLPEEIQELIAESEVLPDFPLISQLDASPNVVGIGDVVALSGAPKLSGTVRITHGSLSETVAFSSGSGSYTIPEDAPEGVYSISLENEEGAVAIGSFRVASAPGIWLEAGGNYVGTGEFIKLRVTAYQVPLDMVATFRLGDLAQEKFAEDDYNEDFEQFDPFKFDGPSAYLLPASDGELILGSLPGVPLSELVDQTFLLPGRFANQIQVSALDAEIAQFLSEGDYEALSAFDEDNLPEGMEEVSNIVSIQQCNLEGQVSGNLGGAGTVRAISLEGEMETRTFSTMEGNFSIQLPAGKAFIEGWREDGEEFIYFPPQTVEVPCGESIQVSIAALSSPRLASLSPVVSFNNIAAQSGDGEENCERIYITPRKLSVDLEVANLITRSYGAQLDAELSRASVATNLDVLVLFAKAAQEQEQGYGTGQEELNGTADITNADILVYFNILQVDGVFYSTISALDVSSAARITEAILTGVTPQDLSRLPDSFVQEIQKAAVCAKIEPAESILGPNETVELTIEMTDLNGEAHEQVDIKLESKKPICGSLEWTEKSIESTSISNKYTANDELSCSDTVVFVGKTEGPQGKIKSKPDLGTARIIKPILHHFNMTLDFDSGTDGKIDFTWDADFYADEDNAVKTVIPGDTITATGTFTSQNIYCEVRENGVLTFKSEHLNPNAAWDIELGGRMEVFENGFVEVRLIPVGISWNFDMHPFPEECTLLLENILIAFLKTISLQPNIFAPDGAFALGKDSYPLKINYPLEGTNGFDVTITRVTDQP